eukprot:SM000042S15339  [mRNA]  locus=s42:458957:459731:+ [translate_table: standard]
MSMTVCFTRVPSRFNISVSLFRTAAHCAHDCRSSAPRTAQLTILWAFLEVGQTMVVNALAGGGGRRAARRVADRVIAWCAATSLALALATWLLRAPLARSFSQDAALLHAVELAMPPACVMLAMGWNNAMEGVLLGAGDVNFVVLGFLPAAGSGIATVCHPLPPSAWAEAV